MNITNKLTFELQHRGISPSVDAVQNECCSRSLEISLQNDGTPWPIPSDVTAALAYKKSDYTRGLYDKLPDGSSAVNINSNVVTISLAPQVVTVAGDVEASVVLLQVGTLNRLATFPFKINVAADPSSGKTISNNYYRFSSMEEVDGAMRAMESTINRAVSATDSYFRVVLPNNLWDYSSTVTGQLLQDGNVHTEAAHHLLYSVTDFIPVTPGEKIYDYQHTGNVGSGEVKMIIPSTGAGSAMCAYDQNRVLIRYSYSEDIGAPYIVPDNCYFIRYQKSKEHFTSTWRKFGLFKHPLSSGAEWTEYEPPKVYLQGVIDPSNPTKLSQLENDMGYIRVADNESPAVSCWGDSLTDGAGSTGGHTYPAYLNELLSGQKSVHNYGIGGEGCSAIAMRMGAHFFYAEPFTIPADTQSVTCTLTNAEGNPVDFMLRGGSAQNPNLSNFNINPVIISGIAGTLSRPSSEKPAAYTFTRLKAGSAKILTRPVFVSTKGYRESLMDIAVIWAGTNDNQSWKGPDYISNHLDAMIRTLKTGRYIIIGLTSKSMHPNIETENAALFSKYGNRFLDVRKYILKYGLADAGISPTAQDRKDLADGEIPASLRADPIHLNNAGYKIVAQQVYNFGKQLGFWN